MTTVSVRYIVTDVAEAIDFYCRHLGFREDMHPAPTFAMLSRGDLRLVLSGNWSGSSASTAHIFAMTSSPASAASRSCLKTPLAIRSNCSSQPFSRPGSHRSGG